MTHSTFDTLALQDDFGSLPAFKDRQPTDTWSAVLAGPLEVLSTFTPAANIAERFCARMQWDRYPDHPPSVLFEEAVSRCVDVAASWPIGGPFRPMIGLCVNYTREGFALHPEWAADPRLRWTTQGNVLLKVIRYLQDAFDHEFVGRHQ